MLRAMPPVSEVLTPAARAGRRPNGVLVLALVVVLGFLSGAAYFFREAPRLRARTERAVAEAPSTPEGKLAYAFPYLQAHVHNALVGARLSEQQPWLVTHTVRVPAEPAAEAQGLPPEVDVWGFPVAELAKDVAHLEGLDLVVNLPEPRLIARTILIGDRARDVPVYDAGAVPFEPRERLVWLASYFLRRLSASLPSDVPGARIVLDVGGWRLPAAEIRG